MVATKKLGVELGAKEKITGTLRTINAALRGSTAVWEKWGQAAGQAFNKIHSAVPLLGKVERGVGKIVQPLRHVLSNLKSTATAIKTFGDKAKEALAPVAHSLEILRTGFQLLGGAIRGFWDTFIRPAETAKKLTASLTNVFGGGTAEKIRKFSLDTGLSFESVSKAALDMSSKLGQVGGMDAYLKAIERVSAWRPDLGSEGAIQYVNDLIGRLGEVTGAGSKQLGQYTSVVTGGVGARAIDLGKELDKLGVINKVVDPSITALDKLRAKWEEFKATVGGKIFDKVAEGAMKLLDWLTANEDKVLSLTDKFVEWINTGIQKLIEWLDSDSPQKLLDTLSAAADTIERIANSPLVQAIGQTITKPAESFGKAAETVRMGTAVGAGLLGRLFGGKETGANWAQAVAGIPTARERKQADINVGIDPKNGNVTAYWNNQNAEMATAMNGGEMTPAYGR